MTFRRLTAVHVIGDELIGTTAAVSSVGCHGVIDLSFIYFYNLHT